MIAYCPLDLPKVMVDEDVVNLLIDTYNPGHHDGIWDTLPLLGKVNSQEDFLNAKEFEKAWEKRYDYDGIIKENILVSDKLKPIFDQFKKLPMQVTHAQILRANKNVPKHHDMKHKNGKFIIKGTDYEPNGWKILLNKFEFKSFFICESMDSEPQYINLPNSTNTFVINEKNYPHGSTFVPDKCMVSIFGLVDKVKADNLIIKSSIRYSDQVLSF